MREGIVSALLDYVYNNALTFEGGKADIPLNTSLIEAGIIDSYGMIEMLAFIERNWDIKIRDEDFTREKMGSIQKMSVLIGEKIKKQAS